MPAKALATDAFHKITIPGQRSKFSAWFNAFGELLDCERIDRADRSYPCTGAQWDKLRRGPWSAKQHVTFNA